MAIAAAAADVCALCGISKIHILKPHRIRYQLTPEKNEQYEMRVADTCETYLSAPERAQKDERTLSVDEMTGILALLVSYKF